MGDLATDNDARRLQEAGLPAVQITTGQACHLEAAMVHRGLEALEAAGHPLAALDLLLIENVGNLVCPAAFDLGEDLRLVLLSVTEGEDKPLKYPATFHSADLVVISKSDLADAVDFDRPLAYRNVRQVAPAARVLEVSARRGTGLEALLEALLAETTAGAVKTQAAAPPTVAKTEVATVPAAAATRAKAVAATATAESAAVTTMATAKPAATAGTVGTAGATGAIAELTAGEARSPSGAAGAAPELTLRAARAAGTTGTAETTAGATAETVGAAGTTRTAETTAEAAGAAARTTAEAARTTAVTNGRAWTTGAEAALTAGAAAKPTIALPTG